MRRIVYVLFTAFVLAGFKAQAADPPPQWQGSQAGISNEVLPPWTPVAVSGQDVGVWGRIHRFGPLPLPASAVTAGAEMLAGPVMLTGAADGKPLAWTNARSRVLQVAPHVARLELSAESETLRCSGQVTIEYDGMIRCDLSIAPKAGQASIEKLDLEIPLVGEHALFLHTWPGPRCSAANSIALPAGGYSGVFKPFVWLGDHERGLAWFCESDQNFFNPPPLTVLDIQRDSPTNRVMLRVHLVGTPRMIESPLAYTFGFQATPVKRMLPDAWDYRIVHKGSYTLSQDELNQLAARRVRTIVFHEQWTDIQNYPVTTHASQLASLLSRCHRRKLQLLLYFGYEMSNIAPEWPSYSQQCLVQPMMGPYTREPTQTCYTVCYCSQWQDFLAHGIQQALEDYDADGVYLDGTSIPQPCSNRQHGCGYVRPDGTVGITYPIFAVRKVMKRIYTIVKHHDPKGQVNVHQSSCMTIPTLAFATSYWDGEPLQAGPRPPSPLDVLSLDAFRAEFMGRNWGVPAEFLLYKPVVIHHNEGLSLALLHDVPVRPTTSGDVEESARLWKMFDQFGRHEAQWLPYWSNAKFVSTTPETVKVSLYNRPGRGLVAVIVNAGRQPCDAYVKLDLAALGQPANMLARDVLHERYLTITNGAMEQPLAPLDNVVVWLTPK